MTAAPARLFAAPIEIEPTTSEARLAELVEIAGGALAEARTIVESKDVRDRAEAIRVYARQVNNRDVEIDAGAIRILAEFKLGGMLAETVSRGRPTEKCSESEHLIDRVTLKELGVDRKLSSEAQRLFALGEAEVRDRLDAWREEARRSAGRIIPSLIRGIDKRARRQVREEILARRIMALPDRHYGVIYTDPEWQNDAYSSVTGMDRAAANHYPTSTLAELQQRRVADIAAPDSIMLMWALVPMLAEAFCLLDAWGFAAFVRDPETGFLGLDKTRARYVSSGAWIKYRPGDRMGMGHWFRVDHEILLVATRGKPPAPLQGDQYRSVFDVPASRIHSKKPDLVAEMIEAFWPNLPKIELNRRGPPRPGWDAWGNEVEDAE